MDRQLIRSAILLFSVLLTTLPTKAQGILPGILDAPVAASGGTHTFTFLHANQNLTCSANPCVVTMTSTTAGSLLTFSIIGNQTTSRTISSISAGGTFVPCTVGCAEQDGAHLYVHQGYVLSATGGVTSIAVTMSGSPGNFTLEIDEISYTGSGAISLDSSNGNTITSCTSCATVGLTLSGSSDYVSRDFAVDNCATAPGSPWTNPANINTSGVIGALNQTSAATFNIAQTGGAGGVAQSVMAFK